MKEVIIIGNGGHAKVILDILKETQNVKIIGITSNSLKVGDSFYNIPVIGDDSVLKEYINMNHHIAIGVGGYRDNNIRTQIYNNIKMMGWQFINVIHPSSIISKFARIGEAVVIYPGAIINTGVRIGNNTIIATGASIDHETEIGDNVLVSAGVTIGAYSKIKDNSLIALGAKIISGVNIGNHSLIAAGAVVINDIPANSTVYGIPAKIKPINN